LFGASAAGGRPYDPSIQKEKESRMGNKIAMLLAAVFAAGAAQAGTFTVLQDRDCKLVNAAEIEQVARKVGVDTGLRLSKDMAVRTEVLCTEEGKRYVYSIRASVEKLVSDGEQQRWTPVAHNTGYGVVSGKAALLREVRFTLRDAIRQEP
jgi:hypothetical protein